MNFFYGWCTKLGLNKKRYWFIFGHLNLFIKIPSLLLVKCDFSIFSIYDDDGEMTRCIHVVVKNTRMRNWGNLLGNLQIRSNHMRNWGEKLGILVDLVKTHKETKIYRSKNIQNYKSQKGIPISKPLKRWPIISTWERDFFYLFEILREWQERSYQHLETEIWSCVFLWESRHDGEGAVKNKYERVKWFLFFISHKKIK